MAKLVLYIGTTCHFSKRVIDFLKENPMDIEIKDAWKDEKIQEELIELTGKAQVPCLKMDGNYMHESLDIIEKLKEIQKGN